MSEGAPSPRVCLATADDRSALHALTITGARRPARARRDGFGEWWEVEAQSILRDARPPKDTVMLGLVGPEFVAACRWTLRGDRGHIDAVGVHPEHRGQHLGLTMVLHAVQQMRLSREGTMQEPIELMEPAAPPSVRSVRITARAHRENVRGLRTLISAGMEALDSEDTAPYVTCYRLV